MKTNRRGRKRITFSHLRWRSYAIAAGATTAGAIGTAEAEIHYSGLINFKFESRLAETHSFPLSQGAVLVGIRSTVGFYEHSASFEIKGAAVSNELREFPLSYFSTFLALALPRGSIVSQGYFQRFGFGRLQYYDCGFPQWREPGTWAIGFRFNSGRGMQYGWVRIKWGGCEDNRFTVKDYAWGDPGDQIKVGQTQLDEDEVQVAPQSPNSAAAAPVGASDKAHAPVAPAQGSLGLLALGAVGLQAWRKSRRAE